MPHKKIRGRTVYQVRWKGLDREDFFSKSRLKKSEKGSRVDSFGII